MSENKLGTTPSSLNIRDAVHVAMIAVKYGSGDLANPGDKIKILQGKAYLIEDRETTDYDGIVDPFLNEPITYGQTFWLCLRPGSITSLVHHWQHPKFPATIVTPQSTASTSDIETSRRWIAEYAQIHCSYYSADEAYKNFMCHIEEGEIYYCGTDCHNSGDVKDFDELCKHLSVVLGRPIDQSYFQSFSCTC